MRDPYETAEYERFVEEMAKHCTCKPPWDCPCAGVLAGGLCDNMGNRVVDHIERDIIESDEDY